MIPSIHPWNQQLWQQLTLEPERSHHALLFAGGPGLGKRVFAEALAAYVLIDGNLRHEGLFKAGSHPDFYVIRPEDLVANPTDNDSSAFALSNQYALRLIPKHSGKPKKDISIDQIRMLAPLLSTHSHIAKNRVVLVDNADSMNTSASNALLKSLEEPPANTLFILVSDRADSLTPTIKSRCSKVLFHAPDAQTTAAWLKANAKMSDEDIASYAPMANNHPLLAVKLQQQGYREVTKTLLQSVNNLWTNTAHVSQSAQQWKTIGGTMAIDMLHKLCADLIRLQESEDSSSLFYPVQQSWTTKVANKLDQQRLHLLFDEFANLKRLISTNVDEVLVLESLGNQFRFLPQNAAQALI